MVLRLILMRSLQAADYEKECPDSDFRYVRHAVTGKFYHMTRDTWHDTRDAAMRISPGTIRALRSGKRTKLARYPIGDLEFVA